jgi:putative two-component system response regulator
MSDAAAPKPSVLVVDDTADNVALMSALLKDTYRVRAAKSGEAALKMLLPTTGPAQLPDLILLDIMMPGMDGYTVCRRLKDEPTTRDIPIIFLTAMTADEDETRGLELGAVDYITKPVTPAVLQARVATHLQVKAYADLLRDRNRTLEDEVARRTAEIVAVQDATILMMASLAETRDNETGNHIRRTQHYVRVLALHLQQHPRFADFLSDRNIELLFKSAPLHDIGKVGIPDHILLKPGRYTPEEFAIMKRHPTIGRDAIEQVERQLGTSVEFMRFAKEIAYGHQEKWDGTGYPEGLQGDAIPISARLMAVADVYDALISRRVYKEGMSHDAATAIIVDGRGKHFDPDIVDAFLALQAEFRAIAARFADDDATMHAQRERLDLFTPNGAG